VAGRKADLGLQAKLGRAAFACRAFRTPRCRPYRPRDHPSAALARRATGTCFSEWQLNRDGPQPRVMQQRQQVAAVSCPAAPQPDRPLPPPPPLLATRPVPSAPWALTTVRTHTTLRPSPKTKAGERISRNSIPRQAGPAMLETSLPVAVQYSKRNVCTVLAPGDPAGHSGYLAGTSLASTTPKGGSRVRGARDLEQDWLLRGPNGETVRAERRDLSDE
jgi:hypothetical protein